MKPEELEAKKTYDFAAEYYHNYRTKVNPEGWFFNEMLEMPAVLELLGNVRGKKILDAGCGTGIYAKLLTKRGAIVKGFDLSDEMIKIAKKENPSLILKTGSLYKIPFKEKFDIVLCSLVVHYIYDWDKMLSEVGRVLNKDGLFIFSTGNPVSEVAERVKVNGKKLSKKTLGDYFTERKIYGSWRNINGKNLRVGAYHITYETMIKNIINNGFEILDNKDCYPIKKAKKHFPKIYSEYTKWPFFCAWKVKLK